MKVRRPREEKRTYDQAALSPNDCYEEAALGLFVCFHAGMHSSDISCPPRGCPTVSDGEGMDGLLGMKMERRISHLLNLARYGRKARV